MPFLILTSPSNWKKQLMTNYLLDVEMCSICSTCNTKYQLYSNYNGKKKNWMLWKKMETEVKNSLSAILVMRKKNQDFRVREICQSCQTWPAKFVQILLRTDSRLVFCNRKLMRTDIFFTRTTKPICNFANSVISNCRIFILTLLNIFSCKQVCCFWRVLAAPEDLLIFIWSVTVSLTVY